MFAESTPSVHRSVPPIGHTRLPAADLGRAANPFRKVDQCPVGGGLTRHWRKCPRAGRRTASRQPGTMIPMSTHGGDRSWTDNFEGLAGQPPDPAVWSHELGAGGWGCEQIQHYTSSTSNAALTGDGNLAITARRETDGRITSARIITKHRVTARYGRVEARIKVPAEAGTWPAFWMLGHDIDEVGWPSCGEIDVMEYVDLRPVPGPRHPPWSRLQRPRRRCRKHSRSRLSTGRRLPPLRRALVSHGGAVARRRSALPPAHPR